MELKNEKRDSGDDRFRGSEQLDCADSPEDLLESMKDLLRRNMRRK